MGFKSFCAAALMAAFGVTGAGAATVSETATWTAGNGHTYQVVLGVFSWDEARADAEARIFDDQTGYLATITSAAEWNFVIGALNSAKADLFLGASDADEEGTWAWVTGPEAGLLLDDTYANWNRGEPNDWGSGEDYLAGWSWGSNTGWNDMPLSHSAIKGYLVEFGGTTPVPLPAGLPLVLAGLCGLAALRRFRKA